MPPAINTTLGLFSSIGHSHADGIPDSWNCINAVPLQRDQFVALYKFRFCHQINGTCQHQKLPSKLINPQTIKYGQLLKMNENWNGMGSGLGPGLEVHVL